MKKALTIVSIIFVVSLHIKAQEVQNPKILFEETVFDFGTIMQNSKAEHVFHFFNAGNAPLLIAKAFSSCGCIVPEWPKEPIVPNSKSSIKVKYNTSKIGHFTKVIVVKSTDVESPKTVLRINGKVVAPPKDKE